MGLLPPRSFADRYEWTRARPWLAGCYFGFFISAVFALVIVLHGAGAALSLAFVLVMWPASGVAFAVLAKRRFGERQDADEHPTPTWHRLWSRASDRFLRWTMTLGLIGAASSCISLALPGRSAWDLLTLVGAAFLTATAVMERKQRAHS